MGRMWNTLQDSRCELGESPFWHPLEQALYWIDIPGRAVLRTRGDIAASTVERWPLPQEPGCMAPARSGGLVIALRDGIYRAREWGGALTLLAPADYDTRTTRFNDGKCDPLGRFWAGTLYEPKDQRSATLYCLDPRSTAAPLLVAKANVAVTGNGLAFVPARDAPGEPPAPGALYWADTQAPAVRAWDWNAQSNALTAERVFRQFAPKPSGWTFESGVPYLGRPDGATLDVDGNYWVAMFEGAQLLCFSPGGQQLAALPTPVQCPTMPCFGGEDLRTLFVTSARRGRPAAELVRLPASGYVVSTGVEMAGRPVDFFED